MEEFRTFLETSTIHGLGWIASTKRYLRLAWILVVIGGFSAAGYMIFSSFKSWKDNPVTTTIETLPISEITFPNVTVCPPKGTSTNFNFDLLQSEKMKINDEGRNKLTEYAIEVIQEDFYRDMINKMDIVVEENKYYNWYHDITKLRLPTLNAKGQIKYQIWTKATSGTVNSKYFGDKFDYRKVQKKMNIETYVYPVKRNPRKNNKAVLKGYST